MKANATSAKEKAEKFVADSSKSLDEIYNEAAAEKTKSKKAQEERKAKQEALKNAVSDTQAAARKEAEDEERKL